MHNLEEVGGGKLFVMEWPGSMLLDQPGLGMNR
jgi:hypothetical protein